MMRVHIIRFICLAGCLIFFTHDDVSAARPEVILDSDPLIAKICSRSSSDIVISATVTSAPLDNGSNIFVYQAGFNAAAKNGILQKRHLSLVSKDSVAVMRKPVWDAADLIKENGRKIYTSRLSEDGVLTTIPFAWDRLSALQKGYLNRSPVTQQDDQLGPERLAYLRGVRERESLASGQSFRKRANLLGAIVHSTPVYLGTSVSLDEQHPTLVARGSRVPAIFVGANDGALHAFNADNGDELFAYIPNFLFSKLSMLTEENMPYSPFVDGGIAIDEVKVADHWRTVLVAGLGGGAQGVFALDVSNAGKFDQGDGVLWEFSDADDPDIGNVVATPIIAKFRIDTSVDASIDTSIDTGIGGGIDTAGYRYFAVVAGGLNNYRVDAGKRSKNNASNSLFLLALDKPKSEPWLEGKNYFKMILPSGAANSANGLTGATTVLDSIGAVRYLYLADLQGNIWRIDFLQNAPWRHAAAKKRYKPIFIAKDDGGNRQPITQAPLVLFARTGYLILFGTGKYIERSDTEPASFRTQSFYGVIDTLESKNTTVLRHQLSPRILSVTGRSDHALELTGSTASPVNRGWYLDFIDSEQSGERSVSAASVIDGQLFFNTLIPANSLCIKNHSRAYVLDARNGLPLSAMLSADEKLTGILSDDGLWPPPIILQNTPLPDSQHGTADRYRIRKKILQLKPNGVEEATSIDKRPNIRDVPIESTLSGGRLSWHEIINWRELRPTARRGK